MSDPTLHARLLEPHGESDPLRNYIHLSLRPRRSCCLVTAGVGARRMRRQVDSSAEYRWQFNRAIGSRTTIPLANLREDGATRLPDARCRSARRKNVGGLVTLQLPLMPPFRIIDERRIDCDKRNIEFDCLEALNVCDEAGKAT